MTAMSTELEATRKAPFEARRAIRGRLADSLPGPVVHDLCVIVSELVANSVEHGPGGPIRVTIEVPGDDAALRGEVKDEGTGTVAVPEDESGLGLLIVEALATRWGVYAGSTHVWFELSWR